jgi:hypothetical protein
MKGVYSDPSTCISLHPIYSTMVAVVCVTNRPLRLGLCVCLFTATVFTISYVVRNAVQLQSFDSKRFDFGDERVKPNIDVHGPDFQAVDTIDPAVRGSSSQASDISDPLPAVQGIPSQTSDTSDPFAAYYPRGISTEGNGSLPHVNGLRVAFIGDSLTSYMYLSLATYLRRGRWLTIQDVPDILEERQFNNWNYFYNYTKNSLQPNEQCDCFRPEQNAYTIENRYFTDPVQDNVLYYIKK